MRRHCSPETGFEIRALTVWGRARYLSVTEAPHNIQSLSVSREETFCFFETCQIGGRTHDLRLSKQAASTAGPGPLPFYTRNKKDSEGLKSIRECKNYDKINFLVCWSVARATLFKLRLRTTCATDHVSYPLSNSVRSVGRNWTKNKVGLVCLLADGLFWFFSAEERNLTQTFLSVVELSRREACIEQIVLVLQIIYEQPKR